MSQKWRSERPGADEHASYYAQYVAEAPGKELVTGLESQAADMAALIKGVAAAREGHRYAEGKWSIKEVIGHITDSERVFAYRLLRFARGDATALPSFDENLIAKNSEADSRKLADLGEEFAAVRRATVTLVRPMQDAQMMRRGTASGKEVSARALAWIIAGHAQHHMKVLRERYLS
ncbi:MAG: DinB family protein [Gemmatimonadales bacterium]